MTRWALAPLVVGQAWMSGGTAYLLALVGLAARSGPDPEPPAGVPLRTLVLVPAHDEAGQIQPTVRSLLAQELPADAYEVVVIADNCGDDTAALAVAAGATAWQRDDPTHPGKGPALAWALDRAERERPDTEAVVFVDADCIATPGLLRALDGELRRGALAAQAVYDVGNPEASPLAALRWAGFALMHRVRPRGRRELGLSADLFGTGMAFRIQTLREHPWRSFGVTEDAEYHLELARHGIRVGYAPGGAVVSPMPTSTADALDQQSRWESGNGALARRTVVPLTLAGVRRRDLNLVHAGLEQLVLPQTLLLASNSALLVASAAVRSRPLVAAGALTAAAQAAYVVGGLRVAGAPREVYAALRHVPMLLASKLPIFARIGAGRGSRDWVRTTRNP